MFKRLLTLLAALMLLAFVVTGCGDDSDSGDNPSNGDTAAETQNEDTTVEETDTGADDQTAADDVTPPANLEEAVDRCKENIGNAPQLSDDAKAALQDTCEKAGSGDQEDIQDAAREVCETIVKDSIPEGSPGRSINSPPTSNFSSSGIGP